jgi:hypothetical protein
MRRFIIGGLLVALIVFPLSAYVFLKGAAWGVERYRHSRQFNMTLFSMYMFGIHDGYDKGYAMAAKKGYLLGYSKGIKNCFKGKK